MHLLKRADFWVSMIIVLITAALAIGKVLKWYSLSFFVGPFRANHWLVLVGATYIIIATPLFSIAKRHFQTKYEDLVKLHFIGNLSAFLLVTIHFASQLTRPVTNYPNLGTGLALYIVMMLLVVSGFFYRFQFVPRLSLNTNRLIHVGIALSFYILIGIHILHGLGIL